MTRSLLQKGDRLSLVQSRQHWLDAAEIEQVTFVQLGDNLLRRPRHGPEIPLSAAVNGVAALKHDHIAMPVDVFHTGRTLCSPDRYEFVGLSHC